MSSLKTAMERARRARHEGADTRQAPETRGPVPGGDDSPVYRATRVEPADPRQLDRHRILSYLHQGAVSEQMKMLRTQVVRKVADAGGNSLLVTSARPREGKTFTAANLAVSLSHAVGRTTLLVDADLQKPEVARYFGLGHPPGLSDYLVGEAELADLLVNPGLPRLTLLPGGTPLTISSELLGAPRMTELVGEMKARYPDRFLIFDSTSLLTRADALVFAPLVDGVLLVVEAERTLAREVTRALERLEGTPLVGVVYNKAP